MRVAAQIGQQRIGTGERTLGIHDPFHPTQLGQTSGEGNPLSKRGETSEKRQLSRLERGLEILQEQPPEEPRQHPHGREEARPAGNPSGAVQGQSAAGDEAIDVRMVMQVLAPAVQYGDEADLGYFYEWKKTATGKQPYAVGLQGGRLMAIAGLWETWRSPAGERVRSFTIITTTPNELCAELHDRMPVVLKPDVWPVWLGE